MLPVRIPVDLTTEDNTVGLTVVPKQTPLSKIRLNGKTFTDIFTDKEVSVNAVIVLVVIWVI